MSYKHEAAKSHAEKTEKMKGLACGGRAKGGAAKKSGKTTVNVVVAGRGGGDRAGMPPASPMAAPGAAAGLPSRPAAPVAPPPSPGGGLSALGGLRPQGAKHGGKVERRASGGKVIGYDAGAGSGQGRLEKERREKRRK